MKRRSIRRGRTGVAALVALCVVFSLAIPASAGAAQEQRAKRVFDARVAALAERQMEELGIPDGFFPFLKHDARVRTGRWLYGEPAPDLNNDSSPEIIETDLRYRYSIGGGQQPFPFVESETQTRVTVRSAKSGGKLWTKRYDRDAYPFSMRVGKNGRHGVLVISGLWNFYGTTEEQTLSFDAFEGRSGKLLWSREYTSVSYYDLAAHVSKDAPIMIATFNGLKGRSDDLLIALATIVDSYATTTMTTRTLSIDGATGAEHLHPIVDVGVNWWPIPLPTKDLDGDRLDDFATTNNFGVDAGDSEAQEPPSFGGTVYTRRGNDGSPIWTTSGLEMALYGYTNELPDVVGDRTPDLGVSTFVARKGPLPLPDLIPFVSPFWYRPRVYLLEGSFGSEVWHKPWEWIFSPGDIDRNGKKDMTLVKFAASFKKRKTIFDQLALTGFGHRLWQKRSVWRFNTPPCPEDLCFGGWGFWFDPMLDYQPDGVRDVFFAQSVHQNAAFDDSITRGYDGRNGTMRFEDDSERSLQPAWTAIDGRGSDLVGFEHSAGKVRVSARNGRNQMLWTGTLGGPDQLLPRNSGFWALGFELPGDVCGDLVVNGTERNESFYGIFDGGSGRLLWSKWTGPDKDRPTFTHRTDDNPRC